MRSIILFAVIVATAGCATAPVAAPVPSMKLDEVRALTRRGKWVKVLPVLQQIVFELAPGRPELPEVSYLTGEALFQSGLFLEAGEQFRKTAESFPDSPFAPLALLRAGDAGTRMWRLPQLDPTNGEIALATYQELTARYPESEAAARGALGIQRLRNGLAEKAYRNGIFYLRRKAYDSAILYFKEVVAAFSDTDWAPHALLRLVDSYYSIEYNEERKETCDHLARFFPGVAVDPVKCPAVPDASP